MKEVNKIKNYRLKYKRYYNIEFDNKFDVHHIDFNRNNNDISNLILLPKELHSKYHKLINGLGIVDKNGNLKIDITLNFCTINYSAKIIEQLGIVLQEINQWLLFKQKLDIEKLLLKQRD